MGTMFPINQNHMHLGDIAKIRTFSKFEKNGGKANFACNLLNLRAKRIKMLENNIHRVFKLFLQ